jgi:putative acetyltransferase
MNILLNPVIKLKAYKNQYRPIILSIWEQSVKHTHHFLNQKDFEFFKKQVDNLDFGSLAVYCVFNNQSEMIGFFGVSFNRLEMMFLKPSYIGKGLGAQLLHFAITSMYVDELDVNEQNEQALKFYRKNGFKLVERYPTDAYGKPYPVLKLKLHRK